MNTRERFFKRIREELKIDLPSDAYMERTYAGYHQKAAGAWSGTIRSKRRQLYEIGLFEPIASLVKCPNLISSDWYGTTVECGCIGMCKGIKNKKEEKK